MDDRPPAILFTGFEPSGDDHASAVIKRLLAKRPDLQIHAWGGPKMRAAGANIIEETGKDAVMGIPGLKKIQEHRAINQRVAAWLDNNKIRAHIPVDSPAANFPICKMAKDRGIKVVHLVAPQVWAWGPWRVNKLRRLTDHVCCVLPFEETYFKERDVPAEFVGHPLFDKAPDPKDLDPIITDWPKGEPSLAIMPGSRPAELRKNFPILLAAFRRLHQEHPGIVGRVAATTPEVARQLRDLAALSGGWPEALETVAGETDAVIRWADLALVVSGTVTLQIARQAKPMVIVYKSSPLLYNLLGRWLVRTKHFTLPNLIAGEEIVPEFVPHFGGPEPIVDRAVELLENPEAAEAQRQALSKIADRYEGTNAANAAADAILRVAELEPSANTPSAESESRPA